MARNVSGVFHVRNHVILRIVVGPAATLLHFYKMCAPSFSQRVQLLQEFGGHAARYALGHESLVR